jgi:hypothetical protein
LLLIKVVKFLGPLFSLLVKSKNQVVSICCQFTLTRKLALPSLFFIILSQEILMELEGLLLLILERERRQAEQILELDNEEL